RQRSCACPPRARATIASYPPRRAGNRGITTTRGDRLRMAREKHFKSARLAAKAMGIPVSTYGAHERAEQEGGRDYGPDEATQYARRFGVTPEWLLTGREPFPAGEDPPKPKVNVIGYVGAGAEAHIYDVPPGDL